MSDTVAIVLAAGVGSRLRPLTDTRPKCLLDVGGETILGRMVRIFAAAGIGRVIVSTGYLAPRVAEALAAQPLRWTCVDNPDYATTQNVVSLARALDALGPREGFVKLDGDVVFEPEVLASVLHGGADSHARAAVDRSKAPRDEAMKVRLDGATGRIAAFGKGIARDAADGESIGIEWFSRDAAPVIAAAMRRAIAAGRTDVYYEDVYNDVLAEVGIEPIAVDPRAWIEIDDGDDLARARSRFGA